MWSFADLVHGPVVVASNSPIVSPFSRNLIARIRGLGTLNIQTGDMRWISIVCFACSNLEMKRKESSENEFAKLLLSLNNLVNSKQ